MNNIKDLVISVRFLNQDYTLSQKSYDYHLVIPEDVYKYIIVEYYKEDQPKPDKISASSGYKLKQYLKINGYDNPVIIDRIREKDDYEKEKNNYFKLKTININDIEWSFMYLNFKRQDCICAKRDLIYDYTKEKEEHNIIDPMPYMDLSQYAVEFSVDTNTVNKKEKTTNRKETENMFEKIFKGFKIGAIKDDSVKMSVNGIAFMAADGKYITVNKKDNSRMEVEDFILDEFPAMAFSIPVGKNNVKSGDFIYHNGGWCLVLEVLEDTLKVEKIFSQEIVEIRPTKNIFGFDFYVKLLTFDMNLIGDNNNPFGSLLMYGLLSKEKNRGKSSISDLFMLMMLSKQNSDMNKMLPLFFLMDEDKNNSFMEIMCISQMMNGSCNFDFNDMFNMNSNKE